MSYNTHEPPPPNPPPIPFAIMPWTILTCPPGGVMGTVRNCYAVAQKICLLKEAGFLRQKSNLSLQGVAAELGVPHSLLVK